jgi:hypothetical protein
VNYATVAAATDLAEAVLREFSTAA